MEGWKGKAGIWKSLLLVGISVTGLVISIACINSYTIFSRSGTNNTFSLESCVKGDEHYILRVEVKVIAWNDTRANVTSVIYLDGHAEDSWNISEIEPYAYGQIAWYEFSPENDVTVSVVISNGFNNDVSVALYRGDRPWYKNPVPSYVLMEGYLFLIATILTGILFAILLFRHLKPQSNITLLGNEMLEPIYPEQDHLYALIYTGSLVGLGLMMISVTLYGTPSFTITTWIGLGILVLCTILASRLCVVMMFKQIRERKVQRRKYASGAIDLFCFSFAIFTTLFYIETGGNGDWGMATLDHRLFMIGDIFLLVTIIVFAILLLVVGIHFDKKSARLQE